MNISTLRAGKTEALSDDLVIAEKRIEFLSKTCQNVSKKISSTFLGSGQDMTAKRIVSMVHNHLPQFLFFKALHQEFNFRAKAQNSFSVKY